MALTTGSAHRTGDAGHIFLAWRWLIAYTKQDPTPHDHLLQGCPRSPVLPGALWPLLGPQEAGGPFQAALGPCLVR